MHFLLLHGYFPPAFSPSDHFSHLGMLRGQPRMTEAQQITPCKIILQRRPERSPAVPSAEGHGAPLAQPGLCHQEFGIYHHLPATQQHLSWKSRAHVRGRHSSASASRPPAPLRSKSQDCISFPRLLSAGHRCSHPCRELLPTPGGFYKLPGARLGSATEKREAANRGAPHGRAPGFT